MNDNFGGARTRRNRRVSGAVAFAALMTVRAELSNCYPQRNLSTATGFARRGLLASVYLNKYAYVASATPLFALYLSVPSDLHCRRYPENGGFKCIGLR
jgi:hypothetical protein